MRSMVYSTLVLLGGIIGGIAWSEYRQPSAPVIVAGDVLQSVDPDHIRLLSYSNAMYTITAQRSIVGGKFDVLFTPTGGKASVHCKLPADLSGMLKPLTHITARRALSVEEREEQFPIYLGNLLLDSFRTEPDGPIMVFANRTEKTIAVISEHYRAEVTIPISAFRRLADGCAPPHLNADRVAP